MSGSIRRAAVAGRWYPGSAAALASAVDGHLAAAERASDLADLVALVAPHAGLMYSGPVAACAYRALGDQPADLLVLVGPSHFVGFAGVAVHPAGGFDTPLGVAQVDEACASALMGATPIVHPHPSAHAREHSLEMQLPFVRRLAPHARIDPLLMGSQDEATAIALADALATVLAGRRAVLVASSDLSH
jgi:AmmeMemoRadiSam system protein B